MSWRNSDDVADLARWHVDPLADLPWWRRLGHPVIGVSDGRSGSESKCSETQSAGNSCCGCRSLHVQGAVVK